ncbi:MAG: riboflavin kinase [Patescibacteria group bacterium]
MRFHSHTVAGEGKGAGIGFPTINFDVGAVPSGLTFGIYRCRIFIPQGGVTMHDGVAHYGPRVTFGGTSPTFEVHLFELPAGDARLNEADVEVFEKIRDVQKFLNVEDLKTEIAKDIRLAKELLAKEITHE